MRLTLFLTCVAVAAVIGTQADRAVAQSGATVAAANISVVQNDALNETTSVTVTTPLTITGSNGPLTLRDGSNRGDYNIQIGAVATANFSSGVTLTSVRQNGRNNGLAPNVGGNTGNLSPDGVVYGTSAIEASADGSLFIPVFGAATSSGANGSEFNINIAAGHFRYTDGWLGGHFRNNANGNGGAMTVGDSSFNSAISLVTAAPPSGSYFLDGQPSGQGGQYTLNVNASTGNSASQNGVLLVTGGKNEDNYALSRANADGSFSLFTRDNGNGDNYEQDGVAFVYVPANTAGLTAGRVQYTADNGAVLAAGAGSAAAGTATVTRTGVGTVLLRITGVNDENAGVLLISAEGGGTTNLDNIVSYEWSQADGGWLVQTRDLTGSTLEDLTAGEGMFTFVFTPVPEPATVLAVAAAVAGLGAVVRKRRRGGRASAG